MEQPAHPMDQLIDGFMRAPRFAVAGASDDPEKYGHKCFAALLNAGYAVAPINPRAQTVMGLPAYPNLAALPQPVQALSIVTPPAITERLLEEAAVAGVQYVWMQPGAEPRNPDALTRARDGGLQLIYGGPCLLVELAVHRRRAAHS